MGDIKLVFKGNYKKVSEEMEKSGYPYQSEWYYTGTLGEVTGKSKNYINFRTNDAYLAYTRISNEHK